jgi:hypothetical protein
MNKNIFNIKELNMRVSKIEPFDKTKSYILATKKENDKLVLPEIDGSNLYNLPINDSQDNAIRWDDGLYVDNTNNHNHDNKSYLDKISEQNGKMTYDGTLI